MTTRATADCSSYVLNCAKIWITNAPIPDIAIVWAKLEGEIAGFIVEKGSAGFTPPEMKYNLSLPRQGSLFHFLNGRHIPLAG